MIFLSLIGAHKLCIVDVYPIDTYQPPVSTGYGAEESRQATRGQIMKTEDSEAEQVRAKGGQADSSRGGGRLRAGLIL